MAVLRCFLSDSSSSCSFMIFHVLFFVILFLYLEDSDIMITTHWEKVAASFSLLCFVVCTSMQSALFFLRFLVSSVGYDL